MGIKKHGHAIGGKLTPEYVAFRHMIGRCYYPKVERYPHYGGRGIKVCDRWLDKESGFSNFLADVGLKPSSKHSLDRYPDTNGNYEPGNVRWATPIRSEE